MRRRATIRIGVLSSLMLGTLAVSGLGSPTSAASGVPGAEFHAPRIPGPSIGPAPSKTPTPAFAPLIQPVVQSWTSTNWSGYALTGSAITSVVGKWTVPRVLAPTTKKRVKRYSSSWVGIDGYNNSKLIQAGTEQDWIRGTAFYQAWWEILPAAETPIGSLAIHPGDAISVSITEGGSSVWTIQMSDTTTHQSFTVSHSYFGPRTSAEWIQEAPTIGRRHVATLADDSNVIFDLSRIKGSNPVFNTSESGAMYTGLTRISTPSAPNPNRDGFAVAYGSVAPPAPTS